MTHVFIIRYILVNDLHLNKVNLKYFNFKILFFLLINHVSLTRRYKSDHITGSPLLIHSFPYDLIFLPNLLIIWAIKFRSPYLYFF